MLEIRSVARSIPLSVSKVKAATRSGNYYEWVFKMLGVLLVWPSGMIRAS
jgi:hypothetical protein